MAENKKNEVVAVSKGKNPQGVMVIDGARITMPADTGRETNKIYVANEAGNKANLVLCESIARIKATESYKEVVDADGEKYTPTFGDFAEKILKMSKASASLYSSVGEVFSGLLDNGYKYGHFVLMLKMRKLLDENGCPFSGRMIVDFLEEHGAHTDMSTRELEELIKNLLAETTEEDEDAGEDAGEDEDTEDAGEDAEDAEEIELDELTRAFDIIRAKATDAGLYESLSNAITELEKRLKGVA